MKDTGSLQRVFELLLGVRQFSFACDAQHSTLLPRSGACEERQELLRLGLQCVLCVLEHVARHALEPALRQHVHGRSKVYERRHVGDLALERPHLLGDVDLLLLVLARLVARGEPVGKEDCERRSCDELRQPRHLLLISCLSHPNPPATWEQPHGVALGDRTQRAGVECVRVAHDSEHERQQVAPELLVDLVVHDEERDLNDG